MKCIQLSNYKLDSNHPEKKCLLHILPSILLYAVTLMSSEKTFLYELLADTKSFVL